MRAILLWVWRVPVLNTESKKSPQGRLDITRVTLNKELRKHLAYVVI